MRKIGSMALVVGFSILNACGGSYGGGGGGGGYTGPTDPGNTACPANTVCARASSFDPATLTVAKGTVVTFDNKSTVDHNVIFDAPTPPGVADIGAFAYGTSTTRTFGTVGTYNFHCTIHAGMTGTITVQ
jgi:plastocyanin